ncbi:MAG: ferric reductase-like transmembrane domain-containing protein [Patescibacteria group bacterium]
MILVYLVCIIATLLWLIAYWPDFMLFSDAYTILLSLGQLSGLIGICLFAINLILSARLKFLENIFLGLNQIYKKHHLIGGVAFILMMIHPLFLLFSRLTVSIEYAKDLIIPGTDFNMDLGIISLLLIMTLLIITFYTKLPYQIWKLTHKFTGAVFIIAAFHSFLIPSTISQNKLFYVYMLIIVSIAITSYLYRTIFFRYLVKKYKYKVTKVKKLTNKVVEITITPSSNQKIEYFAGQFIFLCFKSNNVSLEYHPFSIASADTDEIIIISKVEGDYTEKLMNLEENSEVLVEGAFGRFSYHFYPNPRQIWIAGGIGITPFIGMIKGLKNNSQYNIDLYYCIKDETEKIGVPAPKVNLKLFLSKTMGHITGDYIKKNSKDFEIADFFVCGPPPLMKSIREQLVKLGIKNSKIHSEEFSFD